MKRKMFKLLSVCIATLMLILALALTGCTDKGRKNAEKQVVGRWQSRYNPDIIITFNDDMTWEQTIGTYLSGTWKISGDGNHDKYGHYYVVTRSVDDNVINTFVWFENEPDSISDDLFTVSFNRIKEDAT